MENTIVRFLCEVFMFAATALVFLPLTGKKWNWAFLLYCFISGAISIFIQVQVGDLWKFLVIIPLSLALLVLIFKNIPFIERIYFGVLAVLIVNIFALLLGTIFAFLPIRMRFQELFSNASLFVISYLVYYFRSKSPLPKDIVPVIKKTGPFFVGALLFWYLFLWAYFQLLQSLELKLFLETFYSNRYISHLLNIWSYLPVLSAFLLLVLMLIMITVSIVRFRSRDHQENISYRNNIKILDSYITQIKKDQHDYKHHIDYLSHLLITADNMDQVKEQVTHYTKEVEEESSLRNLILALDNIAYKALFYGYYLKCRENNIPYELITTDLLPAFPLKEYQVVRVFGNLLANAFEYTSSLPDSEDRFIRVELYADRSHNRITITNAIKETDRDDLHNLCSRPSFSLHQEHGMGLVSVREILSDANISFYIEDGESSISFSVSYDNQDSRGVVP